VSQTAAPSHVRVRYAETDQMGVVYYANYFVWFEVARADWLRHAGWTYRDLEAGGVGLPVLETACEYHQPARYDDELEVHASGRMISRIRVRFDYRVVRPADAVLIATGHTVRAPLDRRGRPCRLPAGVQASLAGSAAARPAR
jgi:acyl-CoA thioester hydrolase